MRKCLEWRRPYGFGDPVSHSRSIHVSYASGTTGRCAIGSALKAILTSHVSESQHGERPAVTARRAWMRSTQRESLITPDREEAGSFLKGCWGARCGRGGFMSLMVRAGSHFRGMELQTLSREVGSGGNCKSSVQPKPGICREEWEPLGCFGAILQRLDYLAVSGAESLEDIKSSAMR